MQYYHISFPSFSFTHTKILDLIIPPPPPPPLLLLHSSSLAGDGDNEGGEGDGGDDDGGGEGDGGDDDGGGGGDGDGKGVGRGDEANQDTDCVVQCAMLPSLSLSLS